MNKKMKAKLALEDTIKEHQQNPVLTDCPECKQHLPSSVQREAHRKLHPDHYKEKQK